MQPTSAELAKKLGWPASVPVEKGTVVWKLAPNDDTIIAKLIIDGVKLLATIVLRYWGREVTMLKAIFNGDKWVTQGVMGYADSDAFESICENFRLHMTSMTSSPFYIRDHVTV